MRILIADDHELTRAGLRAVIEREPDLDVVAEASTAETAVERCLAGGVDVAILDIRFGAGMTGLEAARLILDAAAARVLLLTLHDTAEYVRSALSAGATGYVLKDAGRWVTVGRLFRVISCAWRWLPRSVQPKAIWPV